MSYYSLVFTFWQVKLHQSSELYVHEEVQVSSLHVTKMFNVTKMFIYTIYG